MVTGQSNNECVNCTDINGNCTVNETGYKIFPYSENDQKKVILKTPDNTNFTERSEFGDASWLCMVSGTTIIGIYLSLSTVIYRSIMRNTFR